MEGMLTDFSRIYVDKENDAPLSQEEFRRLQLVELCILKEFDRVCRENKINYTISCGTLLGAVRHKGFIPWDDDADISMLREDYEKFRKVANQMDPDICFFQDHRSSSHSCILPSYSSAYTIWYPQIHLYYHCRTGYSNPSVIFPSEYGKSVVDIPAYDGKELSSYGVLLHFLVVAPLRYK